jgi:hypothetical protein
MTFLVINPITLERLEFENRADADAKASEVHLAYLAREEYRFSVAKEVVNGNDTTWMNADLDNDPEDCNYHVFNTYTGQHELANSLSAAKARNAELKAQFSAAFIVPVTEVVQPRTTGSQTL